MKQIEQNNYKIPGEPRHENAEMGIGGPILLWIGLVAIAAIIQLFVFPSVQVGGVVPPALAELNTLASYALYIPGVLVLPVLAALWIGSRAGATTGKMDTIAYRAVINAVYVGIIYLVEIFVFYIIANSAHNTGALGLIPLTSFVEYIVVLPVVICLVVAPLFAIVSSARRF